MHPSKPKPYCIVWNKLPQALASISTHTKRNICALIKQVTFSTLNSSSLKLVDKFTNLGSSVSSTATDIDPRLTKAWTANNRLSVIWKSDLTDKINRSFFQAATVSILLYGCTIWTLTKRMEKKLDGNYTRMQYWTSPGSYTAIYLPSRKLSKLDKPDIAGEAGMSS